MFVQTVLVSLLLILMGLALCFAGYRFFTILLPIWGFFAGFQFGATLFTNIFGEGFLRTVLSWVVGLLVAIFAAVLAYLFYAVAVVLLAGFVGYQLGVGIMTWIGVKEGFLTFLVGLIFALGIAALAIFLRLPKLLIIVLTAFAGAGAILAGIFLAVGRITLDSLRFGEVGAILRDNWLWALLYLAIAAVGFYFQWRTTQAFFVEEYSAENVFVTEGTGATVEAAPGAQAAPDLTPPSGITPAADLPPATA
jgi:hypothetical protein